jgi:hypothetical protein
MQVQGTVNGYGERCGNCNLMSVIAALRLKFGYDCLLPASLEHLTDLSQYEERDSGRRSSDLRGIFFLSLNRARRCKMMTSPFPGMDPYLESANEWSSFHSALISEMANQLNVQLPPGYAARVEGQVYVIPAGAHISPDVTVFGTLPPHKEGANVALADRPQVREPERFSLMTEERTIRFVQILRLKPEREVVAVIELLSPINKKAHSRGRTDYQRKQQRVLDSDAHLLEIDLLRDGEYTLAPPLEVVAEAGGFDYILALNRSDDRAHFYVWRLQLAEELPHLIIPLRNGEKTLLDLQSAFAQCYRVGRYRTELDYSRPPEPPLAPEQEAWANALLVAQGLRS